MSSSTSSSESAAAPRARIIPRRVAFALLVLGVLLEVFTRVKLFDMSKDFRRFRGYEARAARLVAAAPTPTVALIGNSATDRGIDLPTLERAFAAAGHPARADLLVADQSRINTWRFIMERYLASPHQIPTLTVITFYEDDLADGNQVEIGRLAQFFTRVSDWPEVFAVHLPRFSDRLEFVVSSGWATFAASERIRERLLAAVIPDFKEYSEHANYVGLEHQRRRAAARAAVKAAPPPPTYEALDRVLARAKEVGMKLCFVAYPTIPVGPDGREIPPYDVPADLPARLKAAGACYLDLRRIPTLNKGLYADEVHLTDEGRVPYSDALGQALAGELGR